MAKQDWTSTMNISKGWITYGGKFVARCRAGSAAAKHFASFMAANFTPDEYFGLMESQMPGANRTMAPLEVLQTKGYISWTVRRALRAEGLPATAEGVEELRRRSMAAINAARAG